MIKNLFLTGFTVISALYAHVTAQSVLDINPKVEHGQIQILDTDKAELSFDFSVENSDYQLKSTDRPVQFSVCLMNAAIAEDISSIQSDFVQFALTYDNGNNCLYAIQQAGLRADEVYQLTVPVEVPSVIDLGNEQVGFLVNIQPAASMNSANDRDDDKLFILKSKSELKVDYINLIQDLIQPVSSGDDAIDVEILPNPSIHHLGINLSKPLGDAQVYLYDLEGKILINQFFPELNHNKIELNDIPSGRYELVVQSPSLIKNLTKTVIISK